VSPDHDPAYQLTVPLSEADLETPSEFSDMSSLLAEAMSSETFPATASDEIDAGPTLAPLPKRKRQREAKPKRAREFDVEKSGRRFGMGVAAVALACVALALGYREYRLAAAAKPTPQKISLADLIANGPGDNIHLQLTDVDLLADQTVIETESQNLGEARWTYAWIPAVPAQSLGRGNVRIIVGTNRANNDAELASFARQTTLQGLIVNETDSLGSEEMKLLRRGLPGVDVASCYFFREGQGPGSELLQALLLGGGSIIMLGGLAVIAYEVKALF